MKVTHKAVDAVVWGPNKQNENLTFIDVFLAGPHGTSVLVGVVVSPPALTPHTMGTECPHPRAWYVGAEPGRHLLPG